MLKHLPSSLLQNISLTCSGHPSVCTSEKSSVNKQGKYSVSFSMAVFDVEYLKVEDTVLDTDVVFTFQLTFVQKSILILMDDRLFIARRP